MYMKANIPLSGLQHGVPLLLSPLVSTEILGGCLLEHIAHSLTGPRALLGLWVSVMPGTSTEEPRLTSASRWLKVLVVALLHCESSKQDSFLLV